MKISSPAFEDGENIPAHFTCDGENTSPPLEISDIPEEAKSLTFILHDPDAPGPDGFTHWVVFNIDPQTKIISENSVPPGSAEGTNSTGGTGYTPPCPPSGVHHYHFKLYALDSKLDPDGSAKREDIEKAMEGHVLDQAELIGLYSRK